jgi:hypothetical protein
VLCIVVATNCVNVAVGQTYSSLSCGNLTSTQLNSSDITFAVSALTVSNPFVRLSLFHFLVCFCCVFVDTPLLLFRDLYMYAI